MKIKLLLVEDESTLAELLTEFLEVENYEVYSASDGEEGFRMFEKHNPDVCIFDVMMPKLSGFGLLKKIRATNQKTPILMLTAKALKADVIEGLKSGADDYLTKPFNFQELNLRLHNILKRRGTIIEKQAYHIGKYQFNYNTQTLRLNTTSETLTTMEADLLHLLCSYKNQVVERNDILKQLWNNEDFYNFRSLDVFISRLRKYLCQDSSIKIVSVRSKGYKLIEAF